MRLSDIPKMSLFELAPHVWSKFQVHVSSVCDELDLGYDMLEPAGWGFRKLPDGRIWAEHPAAGNSEWDGRVWRWHGESTNFIRSGLAHV